MCVRCRHHEVLRRNAGSFLHLEPNRIDYILKGFEQIHGENGNRGLLVRNHKCLGIEVIGNRVAGFVPCCPAPHVDAHRRSNVDDSYTRAQIGA